MKVKPQALNSNYIWVVLSSFLNVVTVGDQINIYRSPFEMLSFLLQLDPEVVLIHSNNAR